MTGQWSGVGVVDVVGLLRDLALTYAGVLGVVVLVSGWQWLRARRPRRVRRNHVVPLVAVIAPSTVTGGGDL